MTAPISCIVTSYNNAATLAATVNSVLGQSLPVAEIVIADDGSTDGSREMIAAMAQQHSAITPILRPQNVGVAANRDLAIRSARQPFVTHVDGDDLLGRRKIEAEWAALSGRADIVAYSQIAILYPGKWWRTVVLDPAATVDAPPKRVLENLLARSGAIPRDMLLAKSLFEKVGGFTHDLQLYEDWEFKMRLAATAAGWTHSGALGTIYVQRSGTLSGAAAERHRAALQDVAISVLPLALGRVEPEHLAGALAVHFGEARAREITGARRSRRRQAPRRLNRLLGHRVSQLRCLPLVLDLIGANRSV